MVFFRFMVADSQVAKLSNFFVAVSFRFEMRFVYVRQAYLRGSNVH